MRNAHSHFRHAALGFFEGGLMSILPMPFGHGLFILFIFLWPISLALANSPRKRKGHLIKIAVGIATLVSAILLPIKQLDGKVGPMHYEDVPLTQLCQHLMRDWKIYVSAYDHNGIDQAFTFLTEQRMTRREVLERLARETEMDLQIGYCNNGASFLFGAHPCFTSLTPRNTQPY